jgi:hypothetical protein
LEHTCIVIATYPTSLIYIYNIDIKQLQHTSKTHEHLKHTLATCATSTYCFDEWKLIGTQSLMPVWNSIDAGAEWGVPVGGRVKVPATSDATLEKAATAGACHAHGAMPVR